MPAGKWIIDWPIRRKLLLVILATVAVSLVLVMIGIFAYEVTTYHKRLSQEVKELGAFIAANSAPSLAFDDAQTAQEILETLRSAPAVAVAVLYTTDGRVFAAYSRRQQPPAPLLLVPTIQGQRFDLSGRRLELVRRIQKRGRVLGVLYLRADAASLYGRLTDYAGIFLILSLAITAGALLLQRLLQRLISDPLLELAGGAESIAHGDLTRRFPVTSADELGQLAASFNHMTSQLAYSNEVLREREEQLRKSETTLRLAIAATEIGTFDFYPASGELIWSDLAKRHFGLPPEAPVTYQVFLSGIHPEDRERVRQNLARALQPENGGLYRSEYRTIGIVDGKERWLVAQGDVFFTPGGEPVRLIGATLEITDRKRAETELRQAKDELEIRVQERTRELEHTYRELHRETEERLAAIENLRQNEQLLLQQSRLAAMGEMLGNIAHQWRQPLNDLALIIQDLSMDHELGELTDEVLHTAVASSMELILHMSQTIDDFRRFLQPEKEKTRFSMNEALAVTLSLFEATLKTMEVELQVDESGPPLYAEGYQNEFAQVIMNLITNARDVFHERKITAPKLVIRLFREREKSVVTVSDNAGGIADSILDRIFDPYFTTKGPDKGTGIGLFMSKNIIEKSMKGSLTARNTAEGAEFRIEL